MDVREQATIIIAEMDGDDFPVTKQTLIDLLAALDERDKDCRVMAEPWLGDLDCDCPICQTARKYKEADI